MDVFLTTILFLSVLFKAHTYVNTVNVDGDLSSRHCVHSLPEVRPNSFQDSACGGPSTGPASMHCCGPLDDHKDPQVFLQPGSQEVKFMLGPTPAQRHLLERDQQRHAHQLPPHQLPPHVLRSSGGAETSSGTEGEEPPVHMCNSYHHYHHHLMHMHPEGCPHQRNMSFLHSRMVSPTPTHGLCECVCVCVCDCVSECV